MKHDLSGIAGMLLFFGAVQFLFLMMIAEFLYPGYSVSNNYISDLGVGATAPIFNGTIIAFGFLIVLSAYFMAKSLNDNIFAELMVLSGVGALGVGLFPETTGDIHLAFAFVAFLFGAFATMLSARLVRSKSMRVFFIALGTISIFALVLGSAFGITLGIGKGGMERMIVYPILVWAIAFGGYMMGRA